MMSDIFGVERREGHAPIHLEGRKGAQNPGLQREQGPSFEGKGRQSKHSLWRRRGKKAILKLCNRPE